MADGEFHEEMLIVRWREMNAGESRQHPSFVV
jgi:hypothetical protein